MSSSRIGIFFLFTIVCALLLFEPAVTDSIESYDVVRDAGIGLRRVDSVFELPRLCGVSGGNVGLVIPQRSSACAMDASVAVSPCGSSVRFVARFVDALASSLSFEKS